VEKLKKITKKKIIVITKKRRKGDMEMIIADNKKLIKFIKWKPKYNNLSVIVKSCVRWEKKSL